MKKERFLEKLNNGAISGAYLIHGDEDFFKEAAIRTAQELIPEDLRAFNLTVLYEPDVAKLSEICETMPLFMEKTLVIARELAKSTDAGKLMDYIDRMSPSTVLLICLKDKLDANSALLKRFAKIDRDVLFTKVEPGDAMKWCMATAVSNGVSLSAGVARTFVGVVGSDMLNVSNELQKLIDRVGPGGTITAELVSSSVIGNVESKVFSMLDCFTAGKVKDGMRSLRALLNEDRDAPRKVVGFLESRLKLMLQGKKLMQTGMSPKQAAQKMEGNSYANEMACKAALKYSYESLRSLLADISLIVYNNITGAGGGISTELEAVMIAFDWERKH
ncbi:MAG: DNA polymerase III subunit delta [Clostridia bacterium]|nr:DNA polymerase III subunit delta [Clostridia bacterium]